MTPAEYEAAHAALRDIARPMGVALHIDHRARREGKPWICLFARGLLLCAHRNHRDAEAWLRPANRSAER